MSALNLSDVEFITKGLDKLVEDAYPIVKQVEGRFGDEEGTALMKLVALADILSILVDDDDTTHELIVDKRINQFREINVIK